MVSRATSSAVAVVETPRTFVLEQRPAKPGQLAYAGLAQLLGGHRKPGESAAAAVVRELEEEVSLRLNAQPHLLAEGDYTLGQDERGQSVVRHVSLFLVTVPSTNELHLNVEGGLLEVPKTVAGVEAHKDRMTPFAYNVLGRLAAGERVVWH